MSYEEGNKLINDEIQVIAESLINQLDQNGNDISNIDHKKTNKLVTLLIPKLKYQIWKSVNNKDDLNEILNQSIFKIYTRLSLYKPEFRFSTWVYKITSNEIISYYNSSSYSGNLPLFYSSMTNGTHVDDSLKFYNPEVLDFDIVSAVNNEIDNLPEGIDKKVFIDTHYKKMKIKEIAIKYNICASTIKTKQRLTRKKLKIALYERFPTLEENIKLIL